MMTRTRRVALWAVAMFLLGAAGVASSRAGVSAETWANVGRFFALSGVLTAVALFATGSKWWRNRSLRATFYLFLSLFLVLAHGLASGFDLYPPEWRSTAVAIQWFLIGSVFVYWSASFIREQLRGHPGPHPNRRHDDPKPASVSDVG